MSKMFMNQCIGYSRVSTDDQHVDMQHDALKQQVREIKALLRDPDIQVVEAARRYDVSRTTLYKHVGAVAPRQ
ncbi:helix-turn-helix domain-containing protein [Paenalcaligenes hominis]|uniref:helix-turn-helix domain-containing protein n=1 Tax=Paenalcaligenes hominis TaxID=643674 RepID=UPI003524EF68